MRTRLVVGVLALCACKSSSPPGDPVHARVPKVDRAAVLAAPKPTDAVPLLVFVEEDGKLAFGVAPGPWAELAMFAPAASDLRVVTEAEAEYVWKVFLESVVLGRSAKELLIMLNEPPEPVELALEEPRTNTATDDPPPPEEADLPDDEASGGTGTAMALEEGKMGAKDSVRAEGHYKMRRDGSDALLARERARVHAMPGWRGRTYVLSSGNHPRTARTGVDGTPDDEPERLGRIAGAIEDPQYPMPRQQAAVVARGKAKASAVVNALVESEGALLVAHGADVRPLRLLFGPRVRHRVDTSAKWIEVRATAKELVVEVVPAVPVTTDVAKLGETYAALRAKHPDANAVDVLVAPDVDAQRLVDVLVALDTAGARAIALGLVPEASDPQAQLRGKRIVRFHLGRPRGQGVEPAEARRVVAAAHAKLRACYESALAADPELAGTVTVEVAVDAKGKRTVAAAGVDPAVAGCIAKHVEKLAFRFEPGGAAQLRLVFTMY